MQIQESQKYSAAMRLRKAAEYDFVYAKKKSLSGNWFALHFAIEKSSMTNSEASNTSNTLAELGNDKICRLGLHIAKRFAKRAVERNRWKRLAREAFRKRAYIFAGLMCGNIVERVDADMAYEMDRVNRLNRVDMVLRLKQKISRENIIAAEKEIIYLFDKLAQKCLQKSC